MTTYASLDDLAAFGLPVAALASVPDAAKVRALEAASATLDSYLESRYPRPYTSVGPVETMHVVSIAVYTLMVGRGYNPAAAGADVNIRLRYEDAIKWMEAVARGNAQANVVSPQIVAAPTDYNEARIITSPKQGW